MSRKQIKDILGDIYKIDKSLKAYGPQLEKIVVEILATKPEVSVDKKFKRELYQEIMARVSELEPEKKSTWQGVFSRSFSYAFVGALAVIVVVIAVTLFFPGGEKDKKLSFNLGVSDIEDSGFGSLALSESSSPEAKGIGGGGGGEPGVSLPAPGYTELKYVYIGDDFSIDGDTAGVYKRKVNDSVSKVFAQRISDLRFDFVDFSGFRDLSVDQITVSEDCSFGYSINLNLKNASLGVYQNSQKWPRQEPEGFKVKVSDIPSNEEIIAIADAFLKEHNIDMSAYGRGAIDDSWKIMLENVVAEKQGEQVVRQWVQIMYQLVVDGSNVYDEWGNQVGVYAEVDIVNKKLSYLSNVTAQSYDRSKYALETDVNRILEIAGQGGVSGFYPQPRQEAQEIVEVQIDTPEKVFVQVNLRPQDNAEPEILYVPALSFSVVDSDEKTEQLYGCKRIIVPLVKEILEQRTKEINSGEVF